MLKIAGGEDVEVVRHELDRAVAVGRGGIHRLELEREAFGEVPRAHADGLEVLHLPQGDRDLLDLEVGELRGPDRVEFLEARGEVPVPVQVRDHEEGQALVALAHRGELQLPDEGLLQARLGGGDLREVLAVLVVASRSAGLVVAERDHVLGLRGRLGLLGGRRLRAVVRGAARRPRGRPARGGDFPRGSARAPGCSSTVDSWSNRIDCCSCGVSVRCWDSLSWRLCFMSKAAGRIRESARGGSSPRGRPFGPLHYR